MMDNLLSKLSEQTTSLVAQVKGAVVCVGDGKVPPRSGLAIGNGEVVTLARQAEPGEHVPVWVDGADKDATVVGYDGTSGVTLLKVEGLDTSASIADALPAIGNLGVTVAYPVPEGHEARLSMIRCVGKETRLPGGRRIGSYIQTDDARFRGFAGSIVFDAGGAALGITVPGRGYGHGRGESFVVPIGEVMTIVEQIRSGKGVGTGYLGVQTTSVDLPQPADGHSRGLLITGVEEESPAERAGLTVGSFIVAVGGTPTPGLEELYDALTGLRKGDSVTVTVASSEGTTRDVTMEVELRA
jgi:S1-C subfamily serine protease